MSETDGALRPAAHGIVDHGSHDESGQEGTTGFGSIKNTDSEPADFEVSPGGGPVPPIFIPLSLEAEEWSLSFVARHALMRIVGRLRTRA